MKIVRIRLRKNKRVWYSFLYCTTTQIIPKIDLNANPLLSVYCTISYGTVQCSTVQYSIVQYSTVQYSTVQYSTVLYCTVKGFQPRIRIGLPLLIVAYRTYITLLTIQGMYASHCLAWYGMVLRCIVLIIGLYSVHICFSECQYRTSLLLTA